jgi:hypothetical protein
MSLSRQQRMKRLAKKAKRGYRGYPLGTIAFYGEDGSRATKLAAGVKFSEHEPAMMRRWFSTETDVRDDAEILAAVIAYFEENGVLTVSMVDRIIGCPHEEGVDYEGPTCPACPYWAGRDRWTGEMIEE